MYKEQKRTTDMSTFDFNTAAELFPPRGRPMKKQPVSYKRFDTAAEAIRYAMEELAPDLLIGAILEVDEQRFDGVDIRNLYASPAYPLSRAVQQPPITQSKVAKSET